MQGAVEHVNCLNNLIEQLMPRSSIFVFISQAHFRPTVELYSSEVPYRFHSFIHYVLYCLTLACDKKHR